MKKQLFTAVLSILFCNLFAQEVKVAAGIVKRFAQFNSKFISARNVDVWLPENYSAKKKYAVLYMHDGQMLYDSTTTWNHQEWGVDETLMQLQKDGKIRDCIVVGVWNSTTRHSDYFPQKPFEALPKAQQDSIYDLNRKEKQPLFATKIQSDNYLKFLVLELKPFIDSSFSTKKNAKNTFVAGSSMGGLISMYAICEYPSVFGGAACLSTHWPGILPSANNPVPPVFMDYLKTHLPSAKNHSIYFDYGDQTLDAFYAPFQKQVDAIMQSKKYSNKHWMTQFFAGDDHSEKSWRKRLSVPLVFLLRK
jgi:enterochelin esterase-like enzyme